MLGECGVRQPAVAAVPGDTRVRPLEEYVAMPFTIEAGVAVESASPALALRFEEHNGCGDGNIQRLDHAVHRDVHRGVNLVEGARGDPVKLLTYHYGGGLREVVAAKVA